MEDCDMGIIKEKYLNVCPWLRGFNFYYFQIYTLGKPSPIKLRFFLENDNIKIITYISHHISLPT
jgi:hypothetical protein